MQGGKGQRIVASDEQESRGQVTGDSGLPIEDWRFEMKPLILFRFLVRADAAGLDEPEPPPDFVLLQAAKQRLHGG